MKLDVTAVVRLTEQCNFDCTYCYMCEKKNLNMPVETVERIIRSFQQYNEHIAHFTWIGGEPCILSDDFFVHIVKYSSNNNPKGLHVSHSIQTNGYLLSNERRIRLQDLGFKIGISYDGKILQNRFRKTLCGLETADVVSANILDAKKSMGIIAVVTKQSLGLEKEIYEELKSKAKIASLNFYSPNGKGKESENSLFPSVDESRSMMLRFYSLWRDDPTTFQLNPYVEIVRSFFTGRNNICEYSAISCYRIVGINTIGDVYICSRSSGMPETLLGNINSQSIDEVLGADSRRLILDRYLRLRETCCEYFSICSGGCPIEGSSRNGQLYGKTEYCEAKKDLFKMMEADLNDANKRPIIKRKAAL